MVLGSDGVMVSVICAAVSRSVTISGLLSSLYLLLSSLYLSSHPSLSPLIPLSLLSSLYLLISSLYLLISSLYLLLSSLYLSLSSLYLSLSSLYHLLSSLYLSSHPSISPLIPLSSVSISPPGPMWSGRGTGV